VYENEIDLTLNQDEELFEYIVKSPNYVGFRVSGSSVNLPDVIDIDDEDVATVAVTVSEAEGNYPLGDRLINGEDLEVPDLLTIKLNDVC
jgi:hypothetical protein